VRALSTPPNLFTWGHGFQMYCLLFFNHINAESLAIMAFLPPSLITGVYILQYLKKEMLIYFHKVTHIVEIVQNI